MKTIETLKIVDTVRLEGINKMNITEQVELVAQSGNNLLCRIDLETNQVSIANLNINNPEKPIFLASDYLKGSECILKPIAVCEYPDSDSRKIFLYLQNDRFGCIAGNGVILGSIFEKTAAGAIDEFKRLYAHPQQFFGFQVTILLD